MIEHAFTLVTDLFEATTPGQEFINPCCFGEDFAVLLSTRLQAHGIAPSKPIQEDFGWVLLVPFGGHRFTLTIGITDDSIGKALAEWRVGISFEKGLNGIRAWFRPAPAKELTQIAGILEDILRLEPRISELKPA